MNRTQRTCHTGTYQRNNFAHSLWFVVELVNATSLERSLGWSTRNWGFPFCSDVGIFSRCPFSLASLRQGGGDRDRSKPRFSLTTAVGSTQNQKAGVIQRRRNHYRGWNFPIIGKKPALRYQASPRLELDYQSPDFQALWPYRKFVPTIHKSGSLCNY